MKTCSERSRFCSKVTSLLTVEISITRNDDGMLLTKAIERCCYNLTLRIHNYSTMVVRAKKFLYSKPFDGMPKISDFELVEEDLPELKNGEFLAEAVYLSVDPYMRRYAPNLTVGSVFIGSQVAKISDSKNPEYPVGKYVVSNFGWRTHTICNGQKMAYNPEPYILPDFSGVPLSAALGILGAPGNTAYFGFMDICQPKAGQMVVISGAAGAVGNHVGQIAKILNCTVIGLAGSDEKGKWLKDELAFDHFINYKTQNIDEELKRIAPTGVDIYFDNVGGKVSSTILNHLRLDARVAICGSIAGYNDPKAGIIELPMILKDFKLQRFQVRHERFLKRWFEGIEQNLKWLQEGKLKCRETITEGFEKMPEAFVGMLQGDNLGKALVHV